MKLEQRYKKAVDEFLKLVLDKYRNKIEGIILIGSVARGDARDDSDVDLFVVVKERNLEDMEEIYGIALRSLWSIQLRYHRKFTGHVRY